MTQRRIIQRRERARRRKRKVWRIRGLLLLFGCLLFLGGVRRFRQNPIQRYAKANGISMDQYPEELLSLYERNNETETFVEEYPLKKEEEPEIDLSDLSSASEVPLLLQWDQRWGYHRYAGEMMGLSGCGPTALSMVAIFMTGDITKNPRWVADFVLTERLCRRRQRNRLVSDAGRSPADRPFQQRNPCGTGTGGKQPAGRKPHHCPDGTRGVYQQRSFYRSYRIAEWQTENQRPKQQKKIPKKPGISIRCWNRQKRYGYITNNKIEDIPIKASEYTVKKQRLRRLFCEGLYRRACCGDSNLHD